ncbi:MAG TPA: VWA domain-containing protein [Pyrinomonadaceae bacterium]|nr:VWA domain-containing protein [Pyrinomonadaceae bacterium]
MKRNAKSPKETKLTLKNWLTKYDFRIIQNKARIKTIALFLLCFLILSNNVKAQDSDDDTPIKVDTLLLTIPLTVSDKKGRNVPGLKKDNFSIFQNGEKQDIEYFFNEEAPMNVAILLDTSYSTKDVLDNIQKAARDFLKVLRPEDKALIVSFDYRTQILSGLTSDRRLLSSAINRTQVTEINGSDMYDAVLRVIQTYFAPLKGRKAIIVLTDGVVTGRGIPAQQVLDSLQKADTLLYPIIFRTKHNSQTGLRNRRPLTVELLELFAEETAGRFYEKDATKLKEAFESIAEELKKQYLLGFYPQNAGKEIVAGHIRVAVDRNDLNIRVKKKLAF